jgi:hypothetical protein
MYHSKCDPHELVATLSVLKSEIFSLLASFSNRATAIIYCVNILQNFTIVTLISFQNLTAI